VAYSRSLSATAAFLALSIVTSGCANEDAARHFRAKLPALHGQPIALLIEELGPAHPAEAGPQQQYNWGVMSLFGRERCEIRVMTDNSSRIMSSSVNGDAYTCGSMIRRLRKQEGRYRANPGLRGQEGEEQEVMLEQLLGARQQINEEAARAEEDQPESRR
jgi:hypothetical protein